jgi:SAM-dependent methyltransferase
VENPLPARPARTLPDHVLESDPVGAETLRMVYEMRALNDWIYSVVRGHLGRSVVEVGCGIGCFTEELLEYDRIVAVDINPAYTDYLSRRLADNEHARVLCHDIHQPLPGWLREDPVQSVICLNVLEHIEDDVQALRHMRDVLAPGGNVVLLVPAVPFLYSSLDKGLAHFRRYSRAGLNETLRRAGFEPAWHTYINLFGILGWLVNGRILGRGILPSGQLTLYNRLVPFFRAVERLTGPPIGLSHIVSGVRTAD